VKLSCPETYQAHRKITRRGAEKSSCRGQTVRFAHVTNLQVEGKQKLVLCKPIIDTGIETTSYKVLPLANTGCPT
jgi:peroxiredoxin